MEEYSPVRYTVEERRYLLMMKWIKRLCSLILLCLLIAGGILLFQGYREYREALSGKSVEEMARQIESIDNYTSLDELPQTYIDAVLAVEELAKNQYFTQEKRLVRKVAEMFMAFKIEAELDKDKILELYVNSIYFGNGYQCVGDACRAYFGKEPSEMTFDECTLLAGIPNAPSNYNPMASEELAHQRQQQVLEKMKKAGYLD